MFTVRTRSRTSRARTGTLNLHRGEVQTPAFVPLATKGAVRTLEPRDLAGLGYEMVLGNTYHLFLAPGAEVVQGFGGLPEFMRWRGPVITDSGGFQVFSMGYGGVADEIKGRGRPAHPGARQSGATGMVLAIEEAGVRFRSHIDGRERFLGPETSMEVQAALGSDIALVLDECTPFHVSRDYTARSMERTHRWLGRCLDWHREHGLDWQAVYGIVQGGVEPDLRVESVREVAAAGCQGVAIGGSLGRDKEQMREVVGWATEELERAVPERPRHLLGIGDVDDLIAGVAQGIDTFDCAIPTRIARHGVALVADPQASWKLDIFKGRHRASREPIMEGCPCPACREGFTRGYLHHLLHARELTALRLITLHNLAFVARLMCDLREAIDGGRLEEVSAALLAGAAPGQAAG